MAGILRGVNRLVSLNRRMGAWMRGRRDGREGLNGPVAAAGFTGGCRFLQKTRAQAETVYANSLQRLQAYEAQLASETISLNEQRLELQGQLAELHANAQGIRCERPHVSPDLYAWLTVVFFLAEFGFSYINLAYSSLPAGFYGEAVLSFVCALFLVYLADSIGKHYRRIPLPLDSPTSSTVKVVFELLVLVAFLLGLIGGLTYLRSKGMRAEDEAGFSRYTEYAFFIIGLAFSVAAGWVGSQTEYSGPKFGAAKLERKLAKLTRRLRWIESERGKVASATGSLRELVNRHVERLEHIYVDQYKRHYREKDLASA